MHDPREQLVALDLKPGRTWAKTEIFLGLIVAGLGLLIGFRQAGATQNEINWPLVIGGLGLFVLGGYLAMAGHRSHLYRWNNRNTVTLIDEIRRLHPKGQST
jgi:hypothetical protein